MTRLRWLVAAALHASVSNGTAKVAVCITGLDRTFAQVAPNIAATHLEAVGRDLVDVYVVLGTLNEAEHDHARHVPGRDRPPYPGNLSLAEALDGFIKPVWTTRQTFEAPTCGVAATGIPPHRPILIHQQAYAKTNACWKEIQRRELGRGARYEWGLNLRTDISYGMRLPPYGAWPENPTGTKFVCSEQLGHCKSALLWSAGLEDQWGLVSRAAAPVYFEAVHEMHEGCLYRDLEEAANSSCGRGTWDLKGGGLFGICRGSNDPSQSRLALPLIAFGVNMCMLNVIPVDNYHIQRAVAQTEGDLKHGHDPRPRFLTWRTLNVSLPRSTYGLVQVSKDGNLTKRKRVPGHPGLWETAVRDFEDTPAANEPTYELVLTDFSDPPKAESSTLQGPNGRVAHARGPVDAEGGACAASVRAALADRGWRLDSRRRA